MCVRARTGRAGGVSRVRVRCGAGLSFSFLRCAEKRESQKSLSYISHLHGV